MWGAARAAESPGLGTSPDPELSSDTSLSTLVSKTGVMKDLPARRLQGGIKSMHTEHGFECVGRTKGLLHVCYRLVFDTAQTMFQRERTKIHVSNIHQRLPTLTGVHPLNG